jgi:membrane protein involved in colicin uptake
MVARAATQMAEDARLIAIEQQVEQQTAAAKDAAAQRELQMLANARAEAERARKPDAQRVAAEEARDRAEETAGRLAQEKAAAEQASAQSVQARAQAEAQRAEAERAKADAERPKADAERARSEAEQAAQQPPIPGGVLQLINSVGRSAPPRASSRCSSKRCPIGQTLPDRRIAWRRVWVGAAVTALLFTIGPPRSTPG